DPGLRENPKFFLAIRGNTSDNYSSPAVSVLASPCPRALVRREVIRRPSTCSGLRRVFRLARRPKTDSFHTSKADTSRETAAPLSHKRSRRWQFEVGRGGALLRKVLQKFP